MELKPFFAKSIETCHQKQKIMQDDITSKNDNHFMLNAKKKKLYVLQGWRQVQNRTQGAYDLYSQRKVGSKITSSL